MEKNELDTSDGIVAWIKTNKELSGFSLVCLMVLLAVICWRAPRGDPPPRGYHWGSCLVEDR